MYDYSGKPHIRQCHWCSYPLVAADSGGFRCKGFRIGAMKIKVSESVPISPTTIHLRKESPSHHSSSLKPD